MKYKYILYAVCMSVIFPALVCSVYFRIGKQQNSAEIIPQPSVQEMASAMVTVIVGDSPVQMELESYITGVVLAEMPASFHLEALKAQAVVARTFTLKRSDAPKHANADVCTDYTCCQAYCSIAQYLDDGGTQESVDKVIEAVMATKGQVLVYQGELIEATYFSCSGGRTEDALAVWGSDVPYLSAVNSPGEEGATHFTDTVSFTIQAFCDRLDLPQQTISIGAITYTNGQGVATIDINGITYKGTTVRSLLGLRSTVFVITPVGKNVIITTKGFGHRVGMSQYGADAMAERGSGYEEILFHYYNGTELRTDKP